MSVTLFFISLISAVIPIFIYLFIIWWMDRNEREPFKFLFLNFFWGATGAILLAIIGSALFQSSIEKFILTTSGNNQEVLRHSGSLITAPIVEEFTKGIFLFLFSFNRKFDGVVDGVVYGGAVGLGFGMTENFLYFITAKEHLLTIIIIRTLFSALLHTMSQATFGIFIGYAKFKSLASKFVLIPIGYITAVLIHFIWNFSVSFTKFIPFGFLFMIVYIVTVIIIFQIALKIESKIIYSELFEEVEQGIIPKEHMQYLPYNFMRKRSGWCSVEINRKEYIKNAMSLALKKNHLKNVSAVKKTFYTREVENIRNNICRILNKPYILKTDTFKNI